MSFSATKPTIRNAFLATKSTKGHEMTWPCRQTCFLTSDWAPRAIPFVLFVDFVANERF